MMAIPTLCIGLLPTFESIGYLAPILLLTMRLLQGVALGGEVPSAHVFVTEHVPRSRFGIANSAIAAGLTFGVLIGHFVSTMMSISFTAEETLSYAWRIPFILGGVLGLLAVYLRRYLQETPVFLEMQKKKALHTGTPMKTVLKDFRLQAFIATLSTWLLIAGVVLVLLAPNLMKSDMFGMDASFVNRAALVATFMNIVGSLSAGMLVDRFGLRKTLFGFAVLLAITSFIFFHSLGSSDLSKVGILYAIASFFLGIVACVPMIIIRLFPADIRLTGMGFSYNIGNAIFAGLTTFLVPVIAEIFHPMFIAYYILFLCALGVFLSIYLGKKSLPSYI
ncbi:MAG TPA: MFS transporter, partial [Candidatus Ignatzschineria merdigallinarum]|nr:MFS transporter [Candidatus Ignatzschineria merdigallinarum]